MNTLSASTKTQDEVVMEEVVATPPANDSSINEEAGTSMIASVAMSGRMIVSEAASIETLELTEVKSSYEEEEAEKAAEEERRREEAIAEQRRLEYEEQQEKDRVTAYVYSTESVYEGYFTKYMDLRNCKEVTIDEMNYLIDTIVAGRESVLTGCGEAYIKASQQTGLNPIFLLCLTAQEAGWVVSDMHAEKCNPYSIRMLDDNVELGYVLGDTFSEGIIAGAEWINENYYDEGAHSLYEFIYGNKCYSSSKDKWISGIVSNMNKCYDLLKSYNQQEE
jgi:beta-N-acetylglucosaminidase